MRLHELEVAAFGPFTDPVHVDLDELSAAGLFLLSGPTGAGKTSVLDAVCFALYGEVPGDRGGAKRLRSDQAPPDAEPRVRLVATLAGRRLELTRSPAWQRPKRRGTGLTSQQATVRVREHLPTGWTTLTTRHDEAGMLVGDLLGMNHAQFTQVAMLPQGRFQAFLRADADDRQRLLQQLFGTARFERVETWLRERRTAVRRDHDHAHRVLAQCVARVGEASQRPLPGWDLHDLTVPAAAGEPTSWSAALAGEVAADLAQAVAGTPEVVAAEEAARRAAEQARVLLERRRRLAEARTEQAALEARADEHRRDQVDLDAAQRARAVLPVHALATSADAAAERAERDAAAALAEAMAHLDGTDPFAGTDGTAAPPTDEAHWSAQAEEAEGAAGEIRRLLPSAHRLAVVDDELTDQAARRVAQERERAVVQDRRALAPDLLSGLRARHEAAVAAVRAGDALALEVRALEGQVAALGEVRRLRPALDEARRRLQEARDETLTARERLLDVRERRIAGMAAELAGALASGESCPVCGSDEHPAKAVTPAGAPGRAAERAAQREVDDAGALETLREDEVRGLETRLAAADARLDGEADLDALPARRAAAVERLAATHALGVLAPARHAALQDAERRDEQDAAALARLEAELAATDATGAALERERAALLDALASVGHDPSTLVARAVDLDLRAAAARRAARCVVAAHQAREHAAGAADGLAEAAREAGFAAAAEALEAALDEVALRTVEQRLRRHEARTASVAALLAAHAGEEAGEQTGGDEPEDVPPDLDALEAEHADALRLLGEQHTRVDDLRRRERRLGELAAQVHEAERLWAPLHEELALLTRLSAFVDGRSEDNRWQVRLSAYVLAFRLSQVVAAANVRLGRMSDQRYSLEHTAERGRDRRGGLGLLVRDDWSGESRNPATLSGGETFVVSLALALGLSDVVTAEAGGAALDTLFVDEGFGSLDADTLDDVMGTLDALRDGGRVVGVVSHVAEMRERIPTQLVVAKARRGSTVRVRR